MSNIDAIALSLTGPRLWVIIRRCGLWVWKRCCDSHRYRGERDELLLAGDTMGIIEDSHSELSTAFKILMEVLHRLQPRLELSEHPRDRAIDFRRNQRRGKLSEAWNGFLKRPIDILPSLLRVYWDVYSGVVRKCVIGGNCKWYHSLSEVPALLPGKRNTQQSRVCASTCGVSSKILPTVARD